MADQNYGHSHGPSLLAPELAGEAGGARILANLEGRPATTPRSGARPWVVLFLALLVAAFVWVWLRGPSTPVAPAAPAGPQAGRATAAVPAQAARTRPEAAPSDAPALVVSRPAAPAPEPEVALIVDESAPAADAAEVRQPLALLQAEAADAAPERAAGPPADAGAAARASAAPARAPASPGRTPQAGAGRATASDPDAALLSALMAYGSQSAGSAIAEQVPAPTASFVIRSMPGLSLGERLAQCRDLGILRGELCRIQVCAGQWGIAPECPTAQNEVIPY